MIASVVNTDVFVHCSYLFIIQGRQTITEFLSACPASQMKEKFQGLLHLIRKYLPGEEVSDDPFVYFTRVG